MYSGSLRAPNELEAMAATPAAYAVDCFNKSRRESFPLGDFPVFFVLAKVFDIRLHLSSAYTLSDYVA
jgi:hypothetical protein